MVEVGLQRNGAFRSYLSRLHVRLGDLWWYTFLLFVIHRMGDVINLILGVWVVPKFVPSEDLGAVIPIMSVASFIAFPIAIVLLPVSKFLNVFTVRKEYGKVKALLQDAVWISILFAVGVAVWLFWEGDAILTRLHISDRRIFFPMVGFAILTCIDPIVQTAQRSLQCFRGILFTGAVTPYLRLLFLLLLLAPWGFLGYLTAQTLVVMVSALIGGFVLKKAFQKKTKRESYFGAWREMVTYSAPLLLLCLVSRITLPVESFVIRHRLPLDVSAGYYFANIFGAIPGYASTALMVALGSIASSKFERGEKTDDLLKQSFLYNFFIGGGILLLLVIATPFIFRIPGPWHGYESYSKYVWQVGLLSLLKGFQATFTTHQAACRCFRYAWYVIPITLIEAGILTALPAWQVFYPYLPSILWNWVDSHWVLSLQSFLTVILTANALLVIVMGADWLLKPIKR